jgi:hypothetical protein
VPFQNAIFILEQLDRTSFHLTPLRALPPVRPCACTLLGMATLPASTRPPATTVALRQQSLRIIELSERLSLAAACREEVVLFTRRRMLDWKAQTARFIVVAVGSALTFVAWKSLVSWLG